VPPLYGISQRKLPRCSFDKIRFVQIRFRHDPFLFVPSWFVFFLLANFSDYAFWTAKAPLVALHSTAGFLNSTKGLNFIKVGCIPTITTPISSSKARTDPCSERIENGGHGEFVCAFLLLPDLETLLAATFSQSGHITFPLSLSLSLFSHLSFLTSPPRRPVSQSPLPVLMNHILMSCVTPTTDTRQCNRYSQQVLGPATSRGLA